MRTTVTTLPHEVLPRRRRFAVLVVREEIWETNDDSPREIAMRSPYSATRTTEIMDIHEIEYENDPFLEGHPATHSDAPELSWLRTLPPELEDEERCLNCGGPTEDPWQKYPSKLQPAAK